MTTITIQYTDAIIKQSIRRFWWHKTGWSFALGMLALPSLLVVIHIFDGNSTLIAAGYTVFCLVLLFSGALFYIHRKSSINKYKEMDPKNAELVITETDFEIKSSIASSKVDIKQIREVLEYNDMWLIFFTPAQFITVSFMNIEQNLISEVRTHFTTNNIRVRFL